MSDKQLEKYLLVAGIAIIVVFGTLSIIMEVKLTG